MKIQAKGVVLLILVLSLFVSSAGNSEELKRSEQELAAVGSSVITVEAFMSEISRRERYSRNVFSTPEQRNALLEEMVREEMLYSAARKAGYDWKPEIRAALKKIMVNKYRQDLLEPAIAKITVSDTEIDAYYRKNPEMFMTPRMVRAAVIQISISGKATEAQKEESRKKAEEARTTALRGDTSIASFGELAIRFSDDQITRYRGGDAGFLMQNDARNRWDNDVLEAIFSLTEKGEISQVITAPSGYYIVKLMEIKESIARPLQDVKEILRYQILREKKDRIEQDFFSKLASDTNVRIDNDLLMAIETPGAGTRPEPPAMPGR